MRDAPSARLLDPLGPPTPRRRRGAGIYESIGGTVMMLGLSACRPSPEVPPAAAPAAVPSAAGSAPAAPAEAVSPAPVASPILGCWTVVRSEDPRYPLESLLCLREDHVVARDPAGTVFDAWFVDWAREQDAWRGTVPAAHTWGFDVHFIATLDGDGLTLRSGGGLFDVGLGGRSPDAMSDDGAQRHAECLACIDAVRAIPQFDAMLAGPPYALRSCEIVVTLMRSRGASELPDACRDRASEARPRLARREG